MNLKVFISYSTDDKAIAGNIHGQLRVHGVESFLAHENIVVSSDWKAHILSELSTANAMIVLLSKAYQTSDWTDHELGYYFARTNDTGLIIPISRDGTLPYGFFAHIQAQQLAPGSQTAPFELWLQPLVNAFQDLLIPAIIDQLASCKGARTSEKYMKILVDYYGTMPLPLLQRLMQVATQNANVYNAYTCHDTYLPRLVAANVARLSQSEVEELQMRLDSSETSGGKVVLPKSTMKETR